MSTDNLDPRRGLRMGVIDRNRGRTHCAGRSFVADLRAKTSQSDIIGDYQGGNWTAVRRLGQDAMKLVMGGHDSLDSFEPSQGGTTKGGRRYSEPLEDDSDIEEGDARLQISTPFCDYTTTWSVHEQRAYATRCSPSARLLQWSGDECSLRVCCCGSWIDIMRHEST